MAMLSAQEHARLTRPWQGKSSSALPRPDIADDGRDRALADNARELWGSDLSATRVIVVDRGRDPIRGDAPG